MLCSLGMAAAVPSHPRHRTLGPRCSSADPLPQIAAQRASSAIRSRGAAVARVSSAFPAGGTSPERRRLQIEIDSSRITEDMAAEIEAAVSLAVAEAMEAELAVVQQAVATSVAAAMDEKDRGAGFDLVANVNTFVGVTGIILFERGVWGCWDVVFEDLGVWSELTSIGVGLFILFSIQAFKIPLASWTKPGVDI